MVKTIIGIDIAYEALKICGLTHSGKHYRLVGLNYVPIPKDSWTTDALKNQDEIGKVLREAMANAKPSPINAKDAMIALPETAIYSGTFSMPLLSKAELEQALPYEISERMAINPEEYYIDYETLSSACQPVSETVNALGATPSETKTSNVTTLKKAAAATPAATEKTASSEEDAAHVAIFAVAAKRALVESVIQFCQDVKLNPAGIDIKAGAIVNALIAHDDKRMRLVVDLGASTTGVTVAEGKALHLISSVPIGTKSLGTDLGNALENFKKIAAPILDELVHATKFFENRMCPGRKIEEIVLTGGGSNMQGIEALFQQETGLPTRVGDPFCQVDTHHAPLKPDFAHKFADSVGLAMRGLNA